MAAFSGGRCEDYAEAMVADVERVFGVWCLRVRLDNKDEAAAEKTEGTTRDVPIRLVVLHKYGFLDYVRRRQAEDPTAALFHQYQPNKHGRRNGPASDAIKTFVRKRVGLDDNLRKAPTKAWGSSATCGTGT